MAELDRRGPDAFKKGLAIFWNEGCRAGSNPVAGLLTETPKGKGMEPKRARRIRDKLRMKAKAVRIYSRMDSPGLDPMRHAKLADHIAVCSCQMCRNPRRSSFYTGIGRLTMQERRHMEGNGG